MNFFETLPLEVIDKISDYVGISCFNCGSTININGLILNSKGTKNISLGNHYAYYYCDQECIKRYFLDNQF